MSSSVASQLAYNPDGTFAISQPFTMWTEPATGVEITGLLNPDGLTALSQITKSDGTTPEFRFPDPYMWGYIRINNGPGQLMFSASALDTAPEAIAAKIAAQASRDQAITSASAAATSAAAASDSARSLTGAAAVYSKNMVDPGGTTTGTTGSTSDYGMCGWVAAENYYGCADEGADPGVSDPAAIDPIECDPAVVLDAECNEKEGPVKNVGCCAPDGTLYLCDSQGAEPTNKIIAVPCGA